MGKTYYLAGPMTGYPQFNFPAFTEACKVLRDKGYNIISPHELDSPEIQKEALESVDGTLHGGKIAGETWGDVLSRDVRVVADEVQGIIFLPGWHASRGARLEAMVGLLCNHEFHFYNPDRQDVVQLGPDYIKEWIV